jgi:hypothetical protein
MTLGVGSLAASPFQKDMQQFDLKVILSQKHEPYPQWEDFELNRST